MLENHSKNLKVLYIAGSGRSGTTLLAQLLGEIDGFVNIGEGARYFLDLNLQARGAPCGCGRQVPECEFWLNKTKAVPPELASLGTRMVRMRRFPSLLWNSRRQKLTAEYRPILDAMSQLYAQIARETHCEVIVDSSKNPANGLLLSLAPSIEVHIVHVVRNPYDVVLSWTKKKGYLATHATWKVLGWWWSYNLLSELLRVRTSTYHLVRYEDFVRAPGPILQQIAYQVVGTTVAVPFLNGTVANVRTQHSLAGNPDKLNTGRLLVRDAGNAPSSNRNVLVDLLTFPLQLRYRYLFPQRRHS